MEFNVWNGIKKAALPLSILGVLANPAAAQDDGKDNTDFKGKGKIQLWDHTLGGSAGTKSSDIFGIWDNHFPSDAILGGRFSKDSNKTTENSVSGSGAGTTFLNTEFDTKDERMFYGGKLSTPPVWDMRLSGSYFHRADDTKVRGNGTIQIPALSFTDNFSIDEDITTESDEYGLGLRKRFELGGDAYRTLDVALGGFRGKGKTKIDVMQSSGSGTTMSFDEQDFDTLSGYLAAMVDFSENSYAWFRAGGDRIATENGGIKDIFKRYQAELGFRIPLFSESLYAKPQITVRDEEGVGEADGYDIGLQIGCGVPNRADRRHQWASIMNDYLPDELKANAQDVTNRVRDLEAGNYWAFEPHYFNFGKTQGGSIDAIYQRVLSDNYALHLELGYGRTETEREPENLVSDFYRARIALVARDGWSFDAGVVHTNTKDKDNTEFTLGFSYSK